MFKIRHPIPGEPPGALRLQQEPPKIASVITLIDYDQTHLEERVISEPSELLGHLDNKRVTWINIDGLGDLDVLRVLGERFDLHPLALEDVLRPGSARRSSNTMTISSSSRRCFTCDRRSMCGEQVSMFLGKNFLITIQEEAEFDVFDPVRERIRAASGRIRKAGPDYLAYALLDSIIDHYYPVLESLGEAIEDLEDELVENPKKRSVRRLHQYKRTLTQIRRYRLAGTRCGERAAARGKRLVSRTETKVFLRDCYDHTVQLMDLVESYRDVPSGLMELYLSTVSMRTNEIMRVLTVISSIFIPLTFIVGVYGMNFVPESNGRRLPLSMPELYHPLGYIGCLFLMLGVAIFQIVYFKKRGWL